MATNIKISQVYGVKPAYTEEARQENKPVDVFEPPNPPQRIWLTLFQPQTAHHVLASWWKPLSERVPKCDTPVVVSAETRHLLAHVGRSSQNHLCVGVDLPKTEQSED